MFTLLRIGVVVLFDEVHVPRGVCGCPWRCVPCPPFRLLYFLFTFPKRKNSNKDQNSSSTLPPTFYHFYLFFFPCPAFARPMCVHLSVFAQRSTTPRVLSKFSVPCVVHPFWRMRPMGRSPAKHILQLCGPMCVVVG